MSILGASPDRRIRQVTDVVRTDGKTRTKCDILTHLEYNRPDVTAS